LDARPGGRIPLKCNDAAVSRTGQTLRRRLVDAKYLKRRRKHIPIKARESDVTRNPLGRQEDDVMRADKFCRSSQLVVSLVGPSSKH
jgi:hypothetical protein